MKKLAALIVVVVLAVPAIAWAAPKITGADVVDNSLTGADVNESTLVMPKAQIVTKEVTIPDPGGADITHQRVTCPEGTVAIAGGYRNLGPQSMEFPRDGFYPDGRDWVVDMGQAGLETNATIRLWAVCQ